MGFTPLVACADFDDPVIPPDPVEETEDTHYRVLPGHVLVRPIQFGGETWIDRIRTSYDVLPYWYEPIVANGKANLSPNRQFSMYTGDDDSI
jgi:hypothetical protein